MPAMLRRLASAAGRPVGRRGQAAWAAAPVSAWRHRASGDAASPSAAFAGLGAAAAGAALLGLGAGGLHCDDGSERGGFDVKVTTYNVLAPTLSNPSHFPACPPECTLQENRWPKIKARLEREVEAGVVLGLQEVDLLWAGQLHTFFAERGYVAVFAQYGGNFSNYMGVMLAWPRDRYEALDVEISKISDTAPAGTWPKGAKDSSAALSPYGIMSYNGMKELLGGAPPAPPKDLVNFEWDLAKKRSNEAIFARLRPRGQPEQPSFCVATYHMPCLFGPPEKVRVVNIHSYLLMSRFKAFSGSDPAFIMGDFNVKPNCSPYKLMETGGDFDAAAKVNAAELQGLKERLPGKAPWPEGLRSAYREFHQREPLFTNFALSGFSGGVPFAETLDYIWYTPNGFSVVDVAKLPATREEVQGPFPNVEEPSDHLPLRATLRVSSPALPSKL